MTTARDKMAQAGDRVATHRDQLKDINAVYKFVLDGDGGGTWLMDLRDPPSVSEGEGDAQCTIKMTAGDFVDMTEGRANPQQLFFMGKLRIEGDMGLAMKLQPITDLLK